MNSAKHKYEYNYINLYHTSKQKYTSLTNDDTKNRLVGGVYYTFTLKDRWLNLIKNGRKTVEGRLNKGIFNQLRINDIILWKSFNDSVKTKVTYINVYHSFEDMIQTEGLDNILPSINTISDGVNVYREFYKDSDKIYGVVAVGLEIVL